LLFASLVSGNGNKKNIAVPMTASSVVEDIAKKNKLRVIRSKANLHSMMETASKEDVQFFGEELGGFIFPDFQPSFDAMLSSVKLFDLLSKCECSVSGIVSGLPRRSMSKGSVPCPNALKGSVIRTIFDENKQHKAELVDGVKISFGKDWVFINGHPDRQEIYIYSESDDPSASKAYLDQFKARIKDIISKQLRK